MTDKPVGKTLTPNDAASARRSRADADRALLRRVAEGEEAALGKLYDEWAHRVHWVAMTLLRDVDDADDVVEETFWQVWRTAKGYEEGRGAPSSWLLMIARSRAIDRLRARRRRGDWTAASSGWRELGDVDPTAGLIDSDAELHMEGRKAALMSAMRSLPQEQREALDLAFFDGLSHTEIAERTSLPLGTVKTRIRLAMEKLRRCLARDEP